MIRNGKHIRRNEPCPCGSGKKAKRCCLPGIKALSNVPPEYRNMVLGNIALRKAFGSCVSGKDGVVGGRDAVATLLQQ